MFNELDHRPYPPPRKPFVMYQTWHDLLFMHWRVPVDNLRPLVPAALPLDTFDDSAWIAIVPFRMSGVRLQFLPAFPGISAFPELNVRTYVTLDGRPGVYFFSLEAASSTAVSLARTFFHLPYFHARMSCQPGAGGIHYSSQRIQRGAPSAQFHASYRPTGDVFAAGPGSLEYFLTARYCLYVALADGAVARGEIHHAPWPLQPAEVQVEQNSMATVQGIQLPATAPHLLFARRLDVVIWPLEKMKLPAL